MNSHHKVIKSIKIFCTLLRFILGKLALCILSVNFVDDNIMSQCQKDGRHAWHSTECLPSPKAEFRKPVIMESTQSPSCAELTGDLSEQSFRRTTSPSCRLFPCSCLGCSEELKRQKAHRALSRKLKAEVSSYWKIRALFTPDSLCLPRKVYRRSQFNPDVPSTHVRWLIVHSSG